MSWFALAYRQQRFEIIAVTAAVLLWAAAATFFGVRLTGFVAEYPSCFGLTTIAEPICQAVADQIAIWDQSAETLLWLALIIPVLIGILLGSTIVAREVEQQTAHLAWSLATQRRAWLFGRVWPIAVVTLALLVIVAIGGEAITVIRLGGDDPGFQRYDQRGALVIVRGLLALAVAIAVGAWLGRTLPTILTAFAVSSVLIVATVLTVDVWRRAEAEVVPAGALGASSPLVNAMVLEPVAVLPDGTVSSERRFDRLPEGTDFDWYRVIPATEFWPWIGREALVLGGMSGVAVWGAIVITHRRRPM